MKVGRVVYRSDVGEPLLVAAMLFQVGTGLFLAWRWSAARRASIGISGWLEGLPLAVHPRAHELGFHLRS